MTIEGTKEVERQFSRARQCPLHLARHTEQFQAPLLPARAREPRLPDQRDSRGRRPRRSLRPLAPRRGRHRRPQRHFLGRCFQQGPKRRRRRGVWAQLVGVRDHNRLGVPRHTVMQSDHPFSPTSRDQPSVGARAWLIWHVRINRVCFAKSKTSRQRLVLRQNNERRLPPASITSPPGVCGGNGPPSERTITGQPQRAMRPRSRQERYSRDRAGRTQWDLRTVLPAWP